MAAGQARTWFRRIAGAAVLLLAVFVSLYWSALQARFVAYELRTAKSDENRIGRARVLLEAGPAAHAEVVALLLEGDESNCQAIAAAYRDLHVDRGPEPELALRLLGSMASLGEPGREAVLFALPSILQSPDETVRAACRAAVECGLQSTSRVRVFAVKLAVRVNLASEVVPCLSDADAEVRAAALTAIGTAGDAVTIGDEELFRWLNDPSLKVRSVCLAVLQSRGRAPEEIDFGRRLTHPQAKERLQLLVDLSLEPTRDIGPWLERLSRDPEPAVRAGAVRVASERKLVYADWADELARNDPDAAVRQVATYHRRKASGLITPAGYEK